MVVYLTTSTNEVLMPQLKLVDLILLDPKKYKDLKLVNSINLNDGIIKADVNIPVRAYTPNSYSNQTAYAIKKDKETLSEDYTSKYSLKKEEDTALTARTPGLNEEYSYSGYKNYEELKKTPMYSYNKTIDKDLKYNYEDDINKPKEDKSFTKDSYSNYQDGASLKYKSKDGEVELASPKQVNQDSKYNYSKRVKDDLTRQRFSTEKRVFRTYGNCNYM